jgi:hypothetical protein
VRNFVARWKRQPHDELATLRWIAALDGHLAPAGKASGAGPHVSGFISFDDALIPDFACARATLVNAMIAVVEATAETMRLIAGDVGSPR